MRKFKQYHQNEQSPLFQPIVHKKTTTYDIRNPGPLGKLNYNGNTDINKR